jgi:hypothetical protein
MKMYSFLCEVTEWVEEREREREKERERERTLESDFKV